VVAKTVGVGEATIRRAAAVEKHDKENKTGALARIKKGEATVNGEYDKIKGTHRPRPAAKATPPPKPTRHLTERAFNGRMTRLFDALGGLNSALENLRTISARGTRLPD
jgi:hypothetical protein